MNKIIWASLPVAVYILMRMIVYTYVSVDQHGWFFRDFVMNLPRLIGLLLTVFLGIKIWGIKLFKFHMNHIPCVLITGCLCVGIQCFWILMHEQKMHFQIFDIEMYLLGSAFVAMFEELLFRGIIYQAFKDYKNDMYAILFSTALFTLFHFQAQSYIEIPMIFGFGLLMSILRSQSVSIWWLVAIHFAVAALSMIIPFGGHLKFIWMPFVMCGVWGITAVFCTRMCRAQFKKLSK